LDILARINEKARFLKPMDSMENNIVGKGRNFNGVEWTKRKIFSNGESNSSRMPHNTLSISLCGRCTRLYDF